MEEKYRGIHGFKNGAPAYSDVDNPQMGVQLFLDTWGFLPNEDYVLERLDKKQLVILCIFALGVSCRIDLAGDGVKNIQEQMHKFGISPESSTNKEL